jgi:vacuolar-type H+-ATPase catalytic subunit A/Vma1
LEVAVSWVNKVIQEASVDAGDSEIVMARSTVRLIAEAAKDILAELDKMPVDADLPPWWTDMVAVAKADLDGARDYIVTRK